MSENDAETEIDSPVKVRKSNRRKTKITRFVPPDALKHLNVETDAGETIKKKRKSSPAKEKEMKKKRKSASAEGKEKETTKKQKASPAKTKSTPANEKEKKRKPPTVKKEKEKKRESPPVKKTKQQGKAKDTEKKPKKLVSRKSTEDVKFARPGKKPKMWTAEEDELLRSAVKQFGESNWRDVADAVPNRDRLQCLQRWKKALRPGLIKGHWSKDEDTKLLSLIKPYIDDGTISSLEWTWVAGFIEGRNAKQCRERWFLNLDPSINRGPWAAEEDQLLMELFNQVGSRWSVISRSMPGRTENLVKTRYFSLQRNEMRNRGWTGLEDDALVNACLSVGRDWKKVGKKLPGRLVGQLKKRFSVLAQTRAGFEKMVLAREKQLGIQSASKTTAPAGPPGIPPPVPGSLQPPPPIKPPFLVKQGF